MTKRTNALRSCKAYKTCKDGSYDMCLHTNGYYDKIVNVVLENVNTWDYPDFADAFILSAEYENGELLTDKELDELNNDLDFVYNEVMRQLT